MIRNFVLEGANAPGTSATVLLTGARTGRVTWRSAYADGAQAFYFIDDGTAWECGVGTVHYGSPNSLTRTTVISNSAGSTARINFTGAIDVYNEIPGERMGYCDPAGVFRTPGAYLDPQAGGVPIGASMDYWAATLPPGWLWANGAAVSRTTYAKLFSVVSTTFGAGDGASTFNVPDKRARVSVGVDGFGGMGVSGRFPNGYGWGNVLGQSMGDCWLQSHTHGLNWSDPGHGHGVGDPGHAHGVYDPGHAHYLDNVAAVGTAGYAVPFVGAAPIQNTTIGSRVAGTGIGIYGAGTGIWIGGSYTGITASVQAAGNGVVGWQNIPPGIACNHIIYSGAV